MLRPALARAERALSQGGGVSRRVILGPPISGPSLAGAVLDEVLEANRLLGPRRLADWQPPRTLEGMREVLLTLAPRAKKRGPIRLVLDLHPELRPLVFQVVEEVTREVWTTSTGYARRAWAKTVADRFGVGRTKWFILRREYPELREAERRGRTS